MGRPVKDLICTSHIKRQNLGIHMGMRRMTQHMNAFSMKFENLQVAYFSLVCILQLLPGPQNIEVQSHSGERFDRSRLGIG
jgi:hypothetical protein